MKGDWPEYNERANSRIMEQVNTEDATMSQHESQDAKRKRDCI